MPVLFLNILFLILFNEKIFILNPKPWLLINKHTYDVQVCLKGAEFFFSFYKNLAKETQASDGWKS